MCQRRFRSVCEWLRFLLPQGRRRNSYSLTIYSQNMSSSWAVTSKCYTLHAFVAPPPTHTHIHAHTQTHPHTQCWATACTQQNGEMGKINSSSFKPLTVSYGLLRGSKVDLSSWPLESSRTPPSQPWLTISSSPELSLKHLSGPSCLQLSLTVKTCFHTNLLQDLLHALSFEPLPLTAQVMSLGSISTRLFFVRLSLAIISMLGHFFCRRADRVLQRAAGRGDKHLIQKCMLTWKGNPAAVGDLLKCSCSV